MSKRKIILIMAAAVAVLLIIMAAIYGAVSFSRNRLYSATSGVSQINPLLAKSSLGLSHADVDSRSRALSYSASEAEIIAVSDEKIAERMVIKTATLNMVVNNVTEAIRVIKNYVEEKGGYVVNSHISDPTEQARGNIIVRVPAQVFDESLGQFKSYGVKIISEYVSGQDVSEEYADYEVQLRNLEKVEEQFLAIMERSGEIADVLAVQREINNTRVQIERLKGRIQYLEQNVSFSSLTVNLAMEESSLPLVTPDNKWEPEVIVKRALRSLLVLAQRISYLVIWLAIYALIWVPILLLAIWRIRKWRAL